MRTTTGRGMAIVIELAKGLEVLTQNVSTAKRLRAEYQQAVEDCRSGVQARVDSTLPRLSYPDDAARATAHARDLKENLRRGSTVGPRL
jgi:hypothetical protein